MMFDAFDISLLTAINGANTPWMDEIMWLISDKLTWLPLYLALLAMVGWYYRRDGKALVLVLVGLALAVGGADWFVHTLKHWVCRPRPSHAVELEGMLHFVRGYQGGRYGFPSNHAADTAALATYMLLLFYRNRAVTRGVCHATAVVLTLYVVLNCYSRMYLAVHYPTDILVGLMLGVLFAVLAYVLVGKMYHVVHRKL